MPYLKAFLFSSHITCWPIISSHSKAWAGLNLRMDFCLEQIYVVKQLLMFHFCRVVLFVIFLKKVIELLYHATFESSNVKWKVQHLLFVSIQNSICFLSVSINWCLQKTNKFCYSPSWISCPIDSCACSWEFKAVSSTSLRLHHLVSNFLLHYLSLGSSVGIVCLLHLLVKYPYGNIFSDT